MSVHRNVTTMTNVDWRLRWRIPGIWLLLIGSWGCTQARPDSPSSAPAASDLGWPNYGADAGGTRYSSSRQIDRTNVARLRLAWSHRTGGMNQEIALKRKAAFESTPILVENRLYL